jgi:microcystin-dependent protein
MSLPFTPNDAKALIPDPTSTLCGNFLNALLKLPVLFYQFINYAFDSSGNPSKAAVNLALPTGSYIFSAVVLPEDGTKLLCDGRQTISAATYPALATACGTIYGPAAGGNFTIPDCRALFPVGVGNFAHAGACVAGTPVGADQASLIVTNLPSHTHPVHALKVQHGTIDTTVFTPATGDSAQQADGATQPTGTVGAGSAGNGIGTPFNIVSPGFPCYIYIVC